MICYSSPTPPFTKVPTHVLSKIFSHVCLDSKPNYDNRYRLKFALLLSWCCRTWKDALPEKAVDTVTFEHIRTGQCNGAGNHATEWRSNVNEFIKLKATLSAKKLLIIMDSGCECRPTLKDVMKQFRFEVYDWKNIRSIHFAGPGIYEPGTDSPSFQLGEYAEGELDKFKSFLTNITSLTHSLSRHGYVSVVVEHRIPQRLFPLIKQLHKLYEENLLGVQVTCPVQPSCSQSAVQPKKLIIDYLYMKSIGVKREYPIEDLMQLQVLCLNGPLQMSYFKTTSPWTYNFKNLTTITLTFEITMKQCLRQLPTEIPRVYFPSIRNVNIANSSKVYVDFYQMFHGCNLQFLRMIEDAEGLRRVDPQIVKSVQCLDILMKTPAGITAPLPRDILTRFYMAPSSVQDARLVGNGLVFSGNMSWINLLVLDVDLAMSEMCHLASMIVQFPCLWRLRLLCMSLVMSGLDKCAWEPEPANPDPLTIHEIAKNYSSEILRSRQRAQNAASRGQKRPQKASSSQKTLSPIPNSQPGLQAASTSHPYIPAASTSQPRLQAASSSATVRIVPSIGTPSQKSAGRKRRKETAPRSLLFTENLRQIQPRPEGMPHVMPEVSRKPAVKRSLPSKDSVNKKQKSKINSEGYFLSERLQVLQVMSADARAKQIILEMLHYLPKLDRIKVVDGFGNVVRAELLDINKESTISVTEFLPRE